MTHSAIEIRSHDPGGGWPAAPTQRGAQILSLLYQLSHTERWPPDQLLQHQLIQLESLLRHACRTVPHYRQRLAATGYQADGRLTIDAWRRFPLLTRREVQLAGDAMFSDAIPPKFGKFAQARTSGSTGEPVAVLKTIVDQLFWEAITLREHHWHGRNFSGKLASIRVFPKGIADPPQGALLDSWGAPTSHVYVTGPMALLSLTTDVAVQARWLMEHQPDYLLTYPTNLAALIDYFVAHGHRPPGLRAVRTVGETVTPGLRAACLDNWGVPVVDIYSSQEVGYIALQCPVSGQYHVMAETVLVEVLNDSGMPCQAGEVGRLVVTSLHNFASPLIRYELRDYAEVGPSCPCGRGLPTLARILGRSRNMLTLPTGERHWPLVGAHEFQDVAPVRQYQLVQRTLESIEVRLVTGRPLSAQEETRLTGVIHQWLGYPFKLDYVYYAGEIPRAGSGKFEEFVSMVDT